MQADEVVVTVVVVVVKGDRHSGGKGVESGIMVTGVVVTLIK